MKKLRLLSLLLALVMTLSFVFVLVACKPKGGGDDDDDKDVTKYTVTFDVGSEATAAGVKTPESQKVAKGGKVVQPVNDAWEGHNLINWLYNGVVWNFSSDTVQGDMTLVAEWSQFVVDEEYEASLTWGQEGHLYIHYLRGAHKVGEEGKTNSAKAPNYSTQIDSEVYGDWGAWVWQKLPTGGDGRSFYPMKIDKSGAIYDIDLTATYNDAGWNGDTRQPKTNTITYAKTTQIGFQLYQQSSRVNGNGFWVNDGGDVFLDLELAKIEGRNGYHWFVSQNAVPNGTSQFTTVPVDDPYAGIPEGSATSIYDVVSNQGNNTTYRQQPVASGWEQNSVGYQIFISSFADSDGDGIGDLRGIINNLDYLDGLGVDTLWLTPFQTSNSYHGYDIMDYFSVDPRFGTLDDYRELLYKAHQRGMKVLLDFVLNHTSQSNPWFAKSQNLVKETITLPDGTKKEIDYRNFYTWQNEEYVSKLSKSEKEQWFRDPNGYYFYSSFGSSMPELNYDYQATRDAILEVALYWMSFGLDGFRLDAVKHIYMLNENPNHSGNPVNDGAYSFDLDKDLHFFMEFNAKLKASYPNALLLGENFTGNPAQLGGLYGGMDSQFNFHWYYNTTRGIASLGRSSSGASGILNNYTSAQGTFAMYRNDYIDGVFTSNHDVQRARDMLYAEGSGLSLGTQAGTSNWVLSENMAKMYGALCLTVPGITWIYNGDELGMFGTARSNPSQDGSGHEDRWYRQPFKWSKTRAASSYNCYFEMGFNGYHIEWDDLNKQLNGVAEQSKDSSSIYNLYKDIIAVRKQYTVFARGTVESHASNAVICFSVKDANHEVLVYINATPNTQNAGYSVPSGAQRVYGTANGTSLPAWSVTIYSVK